VTAGISIATSVVPGRDHALQTKAIASWRAAGLSVVSVNAAQEVARIQAEFPALKVVTASRTAESIARKPLPFIGDLLRAARSNAPDAVVVGIINADIVLRPVADLADALTAAAKEATVMLPRVDVADVSAIDAFRASGHETYSIGYDGVLMPTAAISSLPESIFCIGMPFWDYWLPFMTLLQGQTLKTVSSPIALHAAHQTRWDQSVYVFFHALVGDVFKVLEAERKSNPTPALDVVLDIFQHTYNDIFKRATTNTNDVQTDAHMTVLASMYDRIQEVVVHHIKAKAEPVKVANAA
jgi:hypothetical protein